MVGGGGMGASLQDPGSMALTHPRAQTLSLLSVRPASDRDQCPASESAHISETNWPLGFPASLPRWERVVIHLFFFFSFSLFWLFG